jgi:hypothetical protein
MPLTLQPPPAHLLRAPPRYPRPAAITAQTALVYGPETRCRHRCVLRGGMFVGACWRARVDRGPALSVPPKRPSAVEAATWGPAAAPKRMAGATPWLSARRSYVGPRAPCLTRGAVVAAARSGARAALRSAGSRAAPRSSVGSGHDKPPTRARFCADGRLLHQLRSVSPRSAGCCARGGRRVALCLQRPAAHDQQRALPVPFRRDCGAALPACHGTRAAFALTRAPAHACTQPPHPPRFPPRAPRLPRRHINRSRRLRHRLRGPAPPTTTAHPAAPP